MNRTIPMFCLLLLFPLLAQAQYHEDVLTGMSGQSLLDQLVTDYRPDTILGYSQAKDTMYAIIDNVEDSVSCVYTGYTLYVHPDLDPSTYLYAGGSAMGINAEHSFPQSKGASTGTAKSNLHHLFPCRTGVNSARSNTPFAEIDDALAEEWYYLDQEIVTIPTQNPELYSERISGDVFEPREDHKGNVARAMLYFYTMYKPEADAEDLTYFANMRTTLCDWHLLDPVDDWEWQRNIKIAPYQENKKNPFVLDCTLAQRTHCPEITVDCQAIAVDIYESFGCTVNDNYPNPFKETTTIDYSLQKPLHVQIEIVNSLGQTVDVLVNGRQNSGKHSLQWNRNDLPAGMYLCQVTVAKAGKSATTVRTMLVR